MFRPFKSTVKSQNVFKTALWSKNENKDLLMFYVAQQVKLCYKNEIAIERKSKTDRKVDIWKKIFCKTFRQCLKKKKHIRQNETGFTVIFSIDCFAKNCCLKNVPRHPPHVLSHCNAPRRCGVLKHLQYYNQISNHGMCRTL